MVEVFKTSVKAVEDKQFLLDKLQKEFPHYKINFDMEDCDKILRIETIEPDINSLSIIELMNRYGFKIEILQDELP
ncbi:hypothetical protein KZP23_13175 [Echinicola marina]|uniref:hypothetical protein n=1 Tax=Echinicola marina TaxID=2859768 RepID=UPI001CF6748E|nr:hypothetical protein [Echinicola marina]UCS91699.1 hypothetical protein KZP23_13175 [Echinicola marina]